MLALSVLFGVGAVSAVRSREREVMGMVGDPVPVLVTVRGVAAGESLDSGGLATRSVPGRWAPPGALSRADQADGMVASAALPAGSYLAPGSWRERSTATTPLLREGERLATVVAVAPPSGVGKGSRVDVVLAPSAGRPVVALRNVEVVATRPSQDGESASGHTVEADLRTDVRGALRLAEASAGGAVIRLLPIGAQP